MFSNMSHYNYEGSLRIEELKIYDILKIYIIKIV